ncbi:hypothetical protein BSF41_27150 [Flavobacterium sp. ACN2]|jgi:hypothetical protein|uniref:hypothetical protein n=1 Tax=unclassified Flavobacterium TaxID=196869 RepID=UPI000BB33D62|nr:MULTISPECIES: hypothetical protein [unclassified Flavobacterium]MDY0989626.1 hypothetical protein [Flavobacterium sp. CFBP9031]PBI87844.1 hypothetical protein BSF41_27150 [Flavobacterium sp. ACN2]
MKIRISILILFIGLLSCEKKEIPKNKFVGTWYDTEYIVPGSHLLKINKDSTFSYKGAGCDWRVISKGKWKLVGDSIELNSTSSDTCYRMFPYTRCIKFGETRRKDTLTIPNCNTSQNADFLIFSKERFYLKNDSLVYEFKASSNCPGYDTLKRVYAHTKKIR